MSYLRRTQPPRSNKYIEELYNNQYDATLGCTTAHNQRHRARVQVAHTTNNPHIRQAAIRDLLVHGQSLFTRTVKQLAVIEPQPTPQSKPQTDTKK